MYNRNIVYFLPLFLVAACQPGLPVVSAQQRSPYFVRYEVASKGKLPTPSETVSFAEVSILALENNPSLKPFNPELRAADGRILQASLRPNPTVDGQIENVLGTGGTRGFSAAESTLAVSQLVERGGKRQARGEVQKAQKALVLSNYEIARRDLFAEVAKAYSQALAAQEKVDLYRELVDLNESFLPEIDKKIEAGKVTSVERIRAKTALTTAKLAAQQAQREFREAALRLAGTWGSTNASFSRVEGKVGELPALEDQSSLERQLYDHPAYRKDGREVMKSVADNRLAITKATSDVTVSGGVRSFAQGDDVALIVGFSIPWPLYDRNQGEIAATAAEVEAAKKRQAATLSELKIRLNQSFQILTATRREVETIKGELLPGAQEAYEGVQDGYSKGRFSYLDLIEARRNLTEARIQLLTANAAYHESAAEIAGLTDTLPGAVRSK